jgi:hypothetical protein
MPSLKIYSLSTIGGCSTIIFQAAYIKSGSYGGFEIFADEMAIEAAIGAAIETASKVATDWVVNGGVGLYFYPLCNQ